MRTRKADATETVVHVAPTPFFADRGCHIRICNEINAVKLYPYRVVLCTYSLGRDVEGIDARRIWPVPGYHKLDAGFSPFRFIADFFLFFLVLKTVWRERPALLHCHLHEGALIGWTVKWCLFWRRIPVVMDMQGSLSAELDANKTFARLPFLLRIFKGVERLVCRMPDHFICSSRQSQICLEKDFKVAPERVGLVQDIVPDAVFATAAARIKGERKAGSSDRKVVLYTGSLQSGKGVQHVLDAMKLLSDRRDDLLFTLVGYPLEGCESFVREHDLQDRSLLPGQVDYRELGDWLSIGDLAIEPKEGGSGEASGKLLHYMAAGLPVVCFDTENNRIMLGPAGYYAPTLDGQGLAEKIEEVLADMEQARQRGAEGAERARIHYSSAAVGDILQRLYSGLIAGEE